MSAASRLTARSTTLRAASLDGRSSARERVVRVAHLEARDDGGTVVFVKCGERLLVAGKRRTAGGEFQWGRVARGERLQVTFGRHAGLAPAELHADPVRHGHAQVGHQRAVVARREVLQPLQGAKQRVLHDIVGVEQPASAGGDAPGGPALEARQVARHQGLDGHTVALLGAS